MYKTQTVHWLGIFPILYSYMAVFIFETQNHHRLKKKKNNEFAFNEEKGSYHVVAML